MLVLTSFLLYICLRITSIVKSNGTFVNNEVTSKDKSLKMFGIIVSFYMSNEIAGTLISVFGGSTEY